MEVDNLIGTARLEIWSREDKSLCNSIISGIHCKKKEMVAIYTVDKGIFKKLVLLAQWESLKGKAVISLQSIFTAPDWKFKEVFFRAIYFNSSLLKGLRIVKDERLVIILLCIVYFVGDSWIFANDWVISLVFLEVFGYHIRLTVARQVRR